MAERDRFLEAVAASLAFGDAERAGIVEELAAHLADSAARLEADGMEPDAAERVAIERLGPPERLADELTSARRTPRRLLAAAGAGTWAAVSGVVYGYLFGLLALTVAWLGLAFALSVVARAFGADWGWANASASNSTITLLALGVGAYAAGLKVTPVVADRAGFRTRAVRRVTTALSAVVILAYSLVIWSGTLDWLALVVLLSLPAWYVVGAWRASGLGFPTRRWRLTIVALALIAFPLAVYGSAPGGTTTSVGAWPGSPESGFWRIGAPAPEAVAAAQTIGSGGGFVGGNATVYTVIDDPAVLAGWADLRVEAWRGVGHDRVDPAARAPFVSAPGQWLPDGQLPPGWIYGGPAWPEGAAGLGGSVRIDRTPGVTWAWLVVTGVAPDGVRYIIFGPSLDQTAFNGTAWDWLAAAISGR